jgi:hypothetical protein
MAYHKHTQYATRRDREQSRGVRYANQDTEQMVSVEQCYSRYTVPKEGRPRHRRWAAGYIDRPSCSSYAYISTQPQSPDLEDPSDTEYITRPRSREVDREQHFEYSPRRTTNHSQTRRSTHRTSPLDPDLRGQYQHHDTHEPYHGSDMEDLSDRQHTYRHATTSKTYDSDIGEGSDIVIVDRKEGDSDVASIHSRSSSGSRSDRYSAISSSMPSNVPDRRRDIDSESDDEEGYISLDDYIAGRSDCVSKRSVSEDEGEGSDVVGSDVEGASDPGEGSDAAGGSDVASLSDDGYFDEEDYIDDGTHPYASR